MSPGSRSLSLHTQITQLKIDHNPFAKGFRDNYDTYVAYSRHSFLFEAHVHPSCRSIVVQVTEGILELDGVCLVI